VLPFFLFYVSLALTVQTLDLLFPPRYRQGTQENVR
jgi:hypothetical protein